MTEQTKPRRRRARQDDGKFKPDNPTTVTNEAWEPVALEDSLATKESKYRIKPKVKGTSNKTTGKYKPKEKIRPTFGKVTTTYH